MASSALPLCNLIRKIRILPSAGQKSALLSTLCDVGGDAPKRLAFVNAHAVNLAAGDLGFLADLTACDTVLRDGSGMKILYKMMKADPGLNLNGTDFIPEVIAAFKGQPVALIGTTDPYLSNAAKTLSASGVQVCLIMNGYRPDDAYIAAIKEQRPALILLGMGMPRQERLAALLAQELSHGCLIVCGGAIIDFIGQKVKRAPMLYRRLGIEWVYRLMQEPRRLFKRYVFGNALFLYHCITLLPGLSAGRASIAPQ